MQISFWNFLKIFFHGKSSVRFLIGVLLSFSFSIAVILGTVGLMDGFDSSLKWSLKKSSGDVILYSNKGFFEISEEKALLDYISLKKVYAHTAYLQTEGFLVQEGRSRGVVVRGIDPETFSKVTSLSFSLAQDEVILGTEIAKEWELQKGDELVLAFAKGNESVSSLPLLKRVKVKGVVEHGIYNKDARFLYIEKSYLQDLLNLSNKVNVVSLTFKKLEKSELSNQRLNAIQDQALELGAYLEDHFNVRTFWREFSSLIKAVEIEKFSISLILQLIILISIFNVAAFMLFVNEKKSQEIFLIRTLGASQKSLIRFWMTAIAAIWLVSCGLSLVFCLIFQLSLKYFSFLKVPGSIYVLNHLTLDLDLWDFTWVFLLALVWVSLVGIIGLARYKKKSILSGLRKEFG